MPNEVAKVSEGFVHPTVGFVASFHFNDGLAELNQL